LKNLNKDILVFVQFVLFIVLGLIFLMSLFIKEISPLVSYLTSTLLIVMMINNIRLSKNKFLSFIYGIAAIIVIILEVFNLWKKDYI